MEEDDDDMYGTSGAPQNGVKAEDYDSKANVKNEDAKDDGSDEDMDESDSDFDIITERAPNAAPAPPPQRAPSQPVTLKHERSVSAANAEPPTKRPSTSTPSAAAAPPPPGTDAASAAVRQPADSLKSGAEFPEVRTSTVELNPEVPYDATGKPITGVDIDSDLAEKEKPWRRPGQDQSEYFNYGFDEFTWTQYCLKQGKLRAEVAGLNAEKESMLGGGAPGMDGMNMNPEDMQQFMQMMASQGGDMSQMGDFSAMMGGGMGGGMGGMGGMGGGGGFGQQGMMDGPQPPTGPSGGAGRGYGRGRGRRW